MQAGTNTKLQLEVRNNVISKYAKLNACSLILIKTYERVDNCPKTCIYMVKLVYCFQVVVQIYALKTPSSVTEGNMSYCSHKAVT